MHQPTRKDLSDPVTATDHVRGAPHARVTVVEYGDFECPTCKQAVTAVKLLLERFPEQVRFAFRHFPQESLHPHALQAAEAAECAAGQGKFWLMHDLLFENQTHLAPKHLHAYAERLELDMPRFTAEMDDEVYRQRIREQIAGGRASRVRATPGFFVDGRIIDVSFDLHALLDATAAALQQSNPSARGI
ncbi:MAG TPA: thioredoxin domain-containing protein [Steroidobacteraceae bacterium]|nr:thioredoxin domain-containing protein [Steroidobacteraceae bacterium]